VLVRRLLTTIALHPATSVPDGPVLLVDDISRTGWTLTVAAALLRDGGFGTALPLIGHKRP
jgi:ATP-dependent DNA helicase RecQ